MALLAAVACLVCAPPAGAGTIGRANVDGSGVNQSFIPRHGSALPYLYPWTIAVDRTHVYWSQAFVNGGESSYGIGRADLNGSGVETIIGGDSDDLGLLGGIAVDAGHLYWTSPLGISRANPDGSAVEPGFITGDQIGAHDVAVAGEHIYWTSADGIGRARLDGSTVQPALITVPRWTLDLAASERHLYWTWEADGRSCGGGLRPCRPPEFGIARARLDGSGVDRHFIPDLPIVDSGYSPGVAVDSRHIYWTDSGSGHIGRARIDGTHIEEAFIRNAAHPRDVAVRGEHLYWTNTGTRLVSIVGSRLTLRRDRRTSVKLACPTLFSLPSEPAPCVGTLRLLTAKPVRYLGDKRRVTLATARYTITEGKRQTLHLRLSERKAALVRSDPRTRRVRAVAEVERTPGDRAIVSEPMTMILAR